MSLSMSEKEYGLWNRHMRERTNPVSGAGLAIGPEEYRLKESESLEAAHDSRGKTAFGPVGPEEYQEKEPYKRTLSEQLAFNDELLVVLYKELQELYGRLHPLMVPCPEECEKEKGREELNCNIVNRLIDQGDTISGMIYNVRRVQRDLQL